MTEKLIQEKIKDLEDQLKLAKQQEYLLSLKKCKWVAHLQGGEIYISYIKTDQPKINLKWGEIYDCFINYNENLSIRVDRVYFSYVNIFKNIFMIFDMNMIIAKSIDDLLNFQKEFELDIQFNNFKQSCDYEINKAKENLDKFTKIKNKLI